MNKAPYVRPRLLRSSGLRVYDIRPTTTLSQAFPHIKFPETYNSLADANQRGFELKRKLDAYKSGDRNDIVVDARSVETLVNHYKSSMAFMNLPNKVNSRGEIVDGATKRSYRGHLNHVLPMCVTNTPFSSMLVSNIDYDYCELLWQYIADDVSIHKANHTFKVLKRVWKVGFKSGKVKGNPFMMVELPSLPDREVMWTDDQLQGMIKHCDDQGYHSMGTMLTMCYEFCQRPVDVRKMKWANIDNKTGVSNFIQKKTGKQMAIKVTNAVQNRLHLHTRRNSDDYIFAYENTNRPFTGDRCNKLFRELADSYGLPEVALRNQFNKDGSQKYSSIWMADLRRTGATHASRSGCTDRELMALTGHKNPSMLVVYAKEGEIESTNANTKRGLL